VCCAADAKAEGKKRMSKRYYEVSLFGQHGNYWKHVKAHDTHGPVIDKRLKEWTENRKIVTPLPPAGAMFAAAFRPRVTVTLKPKGADDQPQRSVPVSTPQEERAFMKLFEVPKPKKSGLRCPDNFKPGKVKERA
jgi:hypothetical protein